MIPFEDQAGQPIQDLAAWNRSRNQQRNWETLLQILGLRAQPMDLGLLNDCNGVPMLTGLTEKSGVERTISTHGADQNIWFLQLNSILEQ
jgi:hypothetical protein